MTELYSKIEKIHSEIDFNSIWRGFNRYEFALYNQDTVYFKDKTIPLDNRFLGNTSIEYEGRQIAIWNVNSPEKEDAEYLAADLVHEMFHAHQRSNGETRYPNDLQLLAYPDNQDNFKLKMMEIWHLTKAFLDKDISHLDKFISLRKARSYMIGDFITQEYKAETLEGMAEYAGLSALEQINKEKFNKRLTSHISKLTEPGDLLFNPRLLAYYTGAVLCHALKILNIDFYHELSNERTLFEILTTTAESSILGFNEYINKKREKFDNFIKNHSEVHQADTFIAGYDPMNMIRLDNRILCERFIILNGEYIQGPVMLILKEGSFNQIESFIK